MDVQFAARLLKNVFYFFKIKAFASTKTLLNLTLFKLKKEKKLIKLHFFSLRNEIHRSSHKRHKRQPTVLNNSLKKISIYTIYIFISSYIIPDDAQLSFVSILNYILNENCNSNKQKRIRQINVWCIQKVTGISYFHDFEESDCVSFSLCHVTFVQLSRCFCSKKLILKQCHAIHSQNFQ